MSATGQFLLATYEQFLLATYEQFSRPPTGSFSCPLTPQQGGGSGDSARASVDAVAERIRETASMWDEGPPEWFGWSVT